MKKCGRIIIMLVLTLSLVMFGASNALAHSGRTDGSGGHNDNNNKSGLGGYHYHCGGYPAHLHTSGYCPYTDVFPSGVTIYADKTTLGIGESISISTSVWPSNACSNTISWSCSDNDVISLSGGTVKALAYGTATITAKTFNGVTNAVTITVKEITADYITVSCTEDNDGVVYIGDTMQLNAEISPANVDNPSIVWTSNDDAIASVDDAGRVSTHDAGSAVIFATASNGVVGEFSVTVNEKFVETVDITASELQLYIGDEHTLKVSVLPEDATYPDVEWNSSDSSVVEVSEDGDLYAKNQGEAIITATSTNGLVDNVMVTVSEIIAERIEIVGDSAIVLGEESMLSVDFYPEDTTIRDIKWAVSDPTVASIDEDGKVTALAVGEFIVTAEQKNSDASFAMQVIPRAVERIELSSDQGSRLHVGEVSELTAEVYPRDATYPDVVWQTSDSGVVVVDQDGLLEAKSLGTAIITAQTADGCIESMEVSVVLGDGAVLLILGGGLVSIAGIIFAIWIRRKTWQNKCW